MARNQTVTGTIFNFLALNRVKKECYYQPLRVDFSPIQRPNNQSEDIIPYFNKDRNYFTPSFILRRQKLPLQENLLTEKNKFEARISHSQNETQEENIEYKPTDSKYCQLCQEYFADYFEHINGKYHKRMINSSKFNKDIVALCKSFDVENKNKNPQKTKRIEKRKVDKKNLKNKDSKAQAKHSKQCMINQQIGMVMQRRNDQSLGEQIQNMEKKNIDESLKITLQLGNYSTNILSNNTFKQLCKDS